MAPTVALSSTSGVSARRWAREKNTCASSTEDEEKERFARRGLRRVQSDSSFSVPREDHESSAGALYEESIADAAGQRGGRTINEALCWADMEDDDEPLEPFLTTLTSSDATPCWDLLKLPSACDKPFAGDKPTAGDMPTAGDTPTSQFPPGVQKCVLPVSVEVKRDAACGLLLQVDTGFCTPLRTPLSAKSRPFVPWILPDASAPNLKEHAAPVCADATPKGAKIRAQANQEIQTTVMLRGLPSTSTREQLIQLLDARGYLGLFNFVYLPVDFETSESVGYAFINLTKLKIAESFKESFEGLTCYPFSDSQPCTTSWSRVQGYNANVKQYRNSPVMHDLVPDEYKPMILWNGLRRAFPAPTTALKELKKPRGKSRREA